MAWMEISAALNTSVSNCKKRWKSLRDTFIKYYRLEHMQDKSQDGKRRRWHFYEMMKFLEPHVELFRLDSSIRLEETQQKEQTIPVYLKDDFNEVASENEKHFYFAEESNEEDAIRYQIKIDQDYDENQQQEEEQIIETFVEESHQDTGNKKSDQAEFVVVEETIKNHQMESNEKQTSNTLQQSPESSQKSTTDPDERYLLSCLPAFKRLTPQQKALVRIGIEKLFYEVEFELEPMSKRFKSS